MAKGFFLTISLFLVPIFSLAQQQIDDGDLLTIEDSFDIYIVKLVDSPDGEKRFRRLILNPEIFNSYGHLEWGNVKTVTANILSEYVLSEFVVEVNADGTIYDPKVYKISSAPESDSGERRWLSITSQEFESLGYDWDSIYHINHTEAAEEFYPIKPALTYEELRPPLQEDEEEAETPIVSFSRSDCDAEVPTSHSSIQAAIDSSQAGDKICLLGGVYRENILIDGKDIVLSGADAANTKIMAVRKSEIPDTDNQEKNSALVIKNVSAQTIIENITITNGNYYAIWLDNASASIQNTIIKDNFAGVRIVGSSIPNINHNIFQNNTHDSAIVFNGSRGDWAIDHNTFLDNGNIGGKAAVLFDSALTSMPVKITNNIFSGGFIGIHEASPTNSLINNNLFYGQSKNYVRKSSINYNSVSVLNGLTFATNNMAGDPLLDAGYKPRFNSPAIDAAVERKSNIGAY